MRCVLAYHGLRVAVAGVSAELEDDLARLGTMMTDGVLRLLSLAEIGPETDPPSAPDIVFGIDRYAGRGMLQWCATGEYAVDPSISPAGGRLLFDGRDLERGVVACEGWQTCLSPATVRGALLDYLRAGRRPRGVSWLSSSAHVVQRR